MDRAEWIKRRDALRAGPKGSAPVSVSTAREPVVVPRLSPEDQRKMLRARHAQMAAETMFRGCAPETVFLAFQAFYMGCVSQIVRAGER